MAQAASASRGRSSCDFAFSAAVQALFCPWASTASSWSGCARGLPLQVKGVVLLVRRVVPRLVVLLELVLESCGQGAVVVRLSIRFLLLRRHCWSRNTARGCSGVSWPTRSAVASIFHSRWLFAVAVPSHASSLRLLSCLMSISGLQGLRPCGEATNPC